VDGKKAMRVKKKRGEKRRKTDVGGGKSGGNGEE